MKIITYTLETLLAFLAGTIGFGILSLLLILITIGLNDFEDYFFLLALPILFAPLYEELGKYLSIKIWKIETFYGFFFGLGWGLLEAIIRYVNREIPASIYPILIHISTAMILCYFIKRKKPILGLITAIVLHVGYNFLITKI